MLLRTSIWLLLIAGCALAQKTGTSDEKLVVDSDTNSKDSEWSNMELIPRNQLCLLCHSVITKFQQASTKNPEQFKNASDFGRFELSNFLGSAHFMCFAEGAD
jgi:hypothetical protein